MSSFPLSISISYPETPHPAYWGSPTGAENFCEEDYIITPYIAEFINTLSNLTYIVFACHGLYQARNRPHSSHLPHLGLLCVGLGSGAFHASLKLNAQFSDSFSMLFATACVLYRVLTISPSPSQRRKIGQLMVGALSVVCVIHYRFNNLIFHSIVFGAMIDGIAYKTMGLIGKIEDRERRRKLKHLGRVGAACSGIGFALWLVDMFACRTLTSIKRSVGLPWGFLFEFHGWWHIFTGIGAYIFIILVEILVSDESTENPYAWPVARLVKAQPGEESSSQEMKIS